MTRCVLSPLPNTPAGLCDQGCGGVGDGMFAELMGRIAGRFSRVEPRRRAEKLLLGRPAGCFGRRCAGERYGRRFRVRNPSLVNGRQDAFAKGNRVMVTADVVDGWGGAVQAEIRTIGDPVSASIKSGWRADPLRCDRIRRDPRRHVDQGLRRLLRVGQREPRRRPTDTDRHR